VSDRWLKRTVICAYTAAGRWFVARTAAQNLDKQTKGKYPAPYLALDSAVASFGLSMKQALAVEAKNFSRASTSPQSKVRVLV